MKKLNSISIIFHKAINKTFGIYCYNGSYFKELTFILYFIEIDFHLVYGKEEKMNNVEVFYKAKEIIEKIKNWSHPFVIKIKEGHIELMFAEGLRTEFSKDERHGLLKVIIEELSCNCHGSGSLRDHLLERLEKTFLEIKKEVKEDFNIPIYK